MHLWALNRGVLMTPFHNMALMSPAHTDADVDRHTDVFTAALPRSPGDRRQARSGSGVDGVTDAAGKRLRDPVDTE